MSIPQWARMFEQGNPGATHYAVEVRYPFLDLRIVDFLLALPPFPFCFEKRLLRDAMAGRLPEACRFRPKTPLYDDPLIESVQESESDRMAGSGTMELGHGTVCESVGLGADPRKVR